MWGLRCGTVNDFTVVYYDCKMTVTTVVMRIKFKTRLDYNNIV